MLRRFPSPESGGIENTDLCEVSGSTLGLGVIKKNKKRFRVQGLGCRVWGLGFGVQGLGSGF